MIVLVTGGRDFCDRDGLFASLDMLHASHPITVLVEGGARGADRLSRFWAQDRRVHYATVPALWEKLGRSAAGPARNSAMLALRPDYCVSFPGGRGTADMTNKCRAAGVATWEPLK